LGRNIWWIDTDESSFSITHLKIPLFWIVEAYKSIATDRIGFSNLTEMFNLISNFYEWCWQHWISYFHRDHRCSNVTLSSPSFPPISQLNFTLPSKRFKCHLPHLLQHIFFFQICHSFPISFLFFFKHYFDKVTQMYRSPGIIISNLKPMNSSVRIHLICPSSLYVLLFHFFSVLWFTSGKLKNRGC